MREGGRNWFGDLEDRPEVRGTRSRHPIGFGLIRQGANPLDRIPVVQDLQSAWLLFLFCAGSRATCYLRVCRLSVKDFFVRQHDGSVWLPFLGICPLHTGASGCKVLSAQLLQLGH